MMTKAMRERAFIEARKLEEAMEGCLKVMDILEYDLGWDVKARCVDLMNSTSEAMNKLAEQYEAMERNEIFDEYIDWQYQCQMV